MTLSQGIQWRCSARGTPWDWAWQAYPGVWIVVGILGAAMWRVTRAGDATAEPASARPTWRGVAAAAGLMLLWLTLDWPVGPLGTGYLASVHALQFIALAMVVPPLLLAGIPRAGAGRALRRRPWLGRTVSAATQPLVAMVGFTLVMAVTHVPRVVDGLMGSQAGAFALDVTWLASGLFFWWPVVVRVPERPRFGAPLRMLYLFFGTQGHLLIAMWLLLAEYPVYGTYELAPRVTALSALQDQQVAGALMLGIGGPFVLGAITVLFFRWVGEGSRDDAGSVRRAVRGTARDVNESSAPRGVK